MGREGFEQLMGFHAAPLLVGLRPASLLSFRRDRFDDFEGLLASYKACFSCKGIEVFRVAEGEAYTLLLFYRAACLRRHLEQAEVRDLLQAYGYPCDEGLDVCLAHLRLRMQLQKSFPHEIGLFHGYPPEDVRGFIENETRNYKFTGYWKVYGDEERSRALFDKFERCTRCYLASWARGTGVERLALAV